MSNIVLNAKVDKKYKILFFVLAGMVFLIFGIYEGIKENQNELHLYLVQTANTINLDLPQIINDETRFDYTEALPKNKFGFYYTLLLETYGEIDIENFKSYIKPNLIKNSKTNGELNNFNKLKIPFVYFFRDKFGKELINIEVTYNEYK
jgi:hypothetical protein